MMQKEQWQGFEGRLWKEEINVRDFIQNNYTPYEGDSSFLADPTEATNQLWGKLQELQKEERAKGGVLDILFFFSQYLIYRIILFKKLSSGDSTTCKRQRSS